MLKIGFDAKRLLNMRSGFGIYARSVVQSLMTRQAEDNLLLFAPYLSDNPILEPENSPFFKSERVNVILPWLSSKRFFSQAELTARVHLSGIDIYHGLSQEIPFSARHLSCPKVVSICDLIYRRIPASLNSSSFQAQDKKLRMAVSISDIIIAISESTKADLIDALDVSSEKIRVIYPSCHHRFFARLSPHDLTEFKTVYDLPDDYILYVGTISERKNLLTLVKAVEQLSASLRLPIVVVGMPTPYKTLVEKYCQEHQISSLVKFYSVERNDDLPGFYQAAKLFVYPSMYEGFGIPIIEAQASGIPVITSNVSSMPEAAGRHSLLIDPSNPDDLAQAIEQALSDTALRSHMIENGLNQARMFCGTDSSKRLIETYQALL